LTNGIDSVAVTQVYAACLIPEQGIRLCVLDTRK